MTWIRVHAIPNAANLDEPRMEMLIDTEALAAFSCRPGEHVQMWLDWDPDSGRPALQIAESLDEIQELISRSEQAAEERRANALLEHNTTPDASLADAIWSPFMAPATERCNGRSKGMRCVLPVNHEGQCAWWAAEVRP